MVGEPPASTASSRRASHAALDRRQTLRAFLHAQDAASLADRLLDLADRDRAVERELQQGRKLGALDGD